MQVTDKAGVVAAVEAAIPATLLRPRIEIYEGSVVAVECMNWTLHPDPRRTIVIAFEVPPEKPKPTAAERAAARILKSMPGRFTVADFAGIIQEELNKEPK